MTEQQTAAMRQALEALELEDMACRYEKEPTPEHIANAITALRQALEQAEPEPGQVSVWWNFKHNRPAYSADDMADLVAVPVPQAEQEPVAWMEDSIEFYAKDHPTSSCTIPLYTTPPTAAQAAKQMRDAAVKVCRDGMECTTDETIKSAVSMVAYQIAALPVPEVQWRDLTDDEEIVIASTPDKSRHWLVCEAISKFKEKQL